MRIGIVSEYARPWPGGISEHVHHEASELAQRGHTVTIITGRDALAEHEAGVLRLGRAVTFTSNGARSRLAVGSFLWRMRRQLAALQLDVLHVHAPLDPCLPLSAAVSAPCPVVGTFHASFDRTALFEALYAHNPLARRAWSRLHARIAVSREARRSAEQYFPGEYRLIPNGVDLERFAASPVRDAAPRRVLFVGRADPRKGLPLLIEAHALLASRGLVFELVLAGVTPAEALAASPNGQASSAAQHVRALGQVASSALPTTYAEADVFCSPAICGESQGVVLLEAMASARPSVCFEIPGYTEVLTHERTGLIARERTSRALATVLERLLRDDVLRRRLGDQARIDAARYAWPTVAGEIEAALLAACADSSRSKTDGARC